VELGRLNASILGAAVIRRWGVAAIVMVGAIIATDLVAHAQQRVNLTNQESVLSEIPFDAGVATTVVVSPNGKRGAYILTTELGSRVVLDGVNSENFSAVGRLSLSFSPDSKRFAFAAQDGDQCFVIEGDHRSRSYTDLVGSSVRFSPDSQHLTFLGIREKSQMVNFDGVEHPTHDGVVDDRLVFSPIGGRLAYTLEQGGRKLVVLDGNESLLADDIGPLVFSGDGGTLAYIAWNDRVPALVLNNTNRLPVRAGVVASSFTLSRDGKKFAYVEKRDNGVVVVASDGESEPYEKVLDGSITFSPDGQHVAFAISRDQKCAVVLDGKTGSTLTAGIAPTSLVFSPDNRRLAYVAEIASREGLVRCVVLDDVIGAPFDRISGAPRYSPDGAHVAYVAERIHLGEVAQFVVVDNTPGKAYPLIRGDLLFAPNGQRVGVMALEGDDRFDARDEFPRLIGNDVDASRRIVFEQTASLKRQVQGNRGHPPDEELQQEWQRPLRVLLVEERIAED
jgi:hypothetical protein